VPIFLARYSANNLGFRLPEGWEKTQPDPGVVDAWKPGMALCAVMGHVVDAIDVDPRNGGTLEALQAALGGELPRVYGVQATPSGGAHYLIASLGVRKAQSVVQGVDIQAGNADGVGRGFIFLAPTVRDSKSTGQPTGYSWEIDPDLGSLLLGDDETGAGLAELVEAHHGRARGKVNSDGSYMGPLYSELGEAQRAESDALVAENVARWRSMLEACTAWPEGMRDDRGRGWEALAYQCAWALAKMASCPWMRIDETGAELVYNEILPPALADDETCAGKWFEGIVEKAAGDPVDVPPWVERGDVEDDFGRVTRPECDATNPAHVSTWLDSEVGRGKLSGVFRRKDDLIYTPRVGEHGYIPPDNPFDSDGPSQVKRMSPLQLANRIDACYRVTHTLKDGTRKDVLFPEEVAKRALSDLDELRNVCHLRMVSHTPIVRGDGSVLDEPGFDRASGVLYLPERGLHVDPVPEHPTDGDVAAATKLLLSMLQDFPFVTVHDRANYLGCLLIPLIRNLVPPPYKMLILGAPQRGSGKSLLALIMRIVHGGVFRSEIPREEDERRKVITSILDSTSAPVVQFDNVSGALRSATFDGLLTSATWSDRRLGLNVNVELTNDRLWVLTGNNVMIGGDLDRRVLWSTINANLEHPELRPAEGFAIPDLEGWVAEHRGEVIQAMLVLVRSWAAAGMKVQPAPTSDSFGRMTQVLQGVLDHAGIPGVIGDQDAKPDLPDMDAEDWAVFLRAAHGLMGDSWWTTRELVDQIEGDDLPGDLADKLRHSSSGVVKSLSKMLGNKKSQWASGLKVEGAGGRNRAMKWQIVSRNEKENPQ
jgi:hypothetical protein